MLKTKSRLELTSLIGNHNSNMSLPTITSAVFITREHLSAFLDQAKAAHGNDFDTVKICFVRYPISNPNPDPSKIIEAGNNLTQVSLIFIPAKFTGTSRSIDWTSEELPKTDNLMTLCVCEPGIDDQDSTGLCPPKLGCIKP